MEPQPHVGIAAKARRACQAVLRLGGLRSWTMSGFQRSIAGALLLAVFVIPVSMAHAQSTLPFEVSNPKNKKWSPVEAGRIYSAACDLLARTVRPENPPALHPRFLLVLGADGDEFVHTNAVMEIHLKSWDAEKFAEAVVLVAQRELLGSDALAKVAHQSVVLAHANISVRELVGNR